jgi:hypothetical protein
LAAPSKPQEILQPIRSGLSDSEISRKRGCSRSSIRKTRPSKINNVLLASLVVLCFSDVQISLSLLASVPLMKPTSQGLCDLRVMDLALTFRLTEAPLAAHLAFARHHWAAQTDWGKAMAGDSTSAWLCNDRGWLWRKPDDDRDEVRYHKAKSRTSVKSGGSLPHKASVHCFLRQR